MLVPVLFLPFVVPLESLPLDDALQLSGRRVVCTAKLESMPQFWGSYTVYGCEDAPDKIERGVMLAGERLDSEGERVVVIGILKVVPYAPSRVNGVALPARAEIVVVEDAEEACNPRLKFFEILRRLPEKTEGTNGNGSVAVSTPINLLRVDFDFAPAEFDRSDLRAFGLEEAGMQGIDHEAAVFLVFDQAGLAQHAEVVRHVDDLDTQQLGQFGDVLFAREQAVDDADPVGFRDRLQAFGALFGMFRVGHGFSIL
jgi:hypothetical protein